MSGRPDGCVRRDTELAKVSPTGIVVILAGIFAIIVGVKGTQHQVVEMITGHAHSPDITFGDLPPSSGTTGLPGSPGAGSGRGGGGGGGGPF